MAHFPLVMLALVAPAASQVQPSEEAVTRPILGFVVLLVLAYIAGRPELARFEEKFSLNPLVTTGLVFVLLGWLAASGQVSVLTESAIRAIGPIVPLGLGWVGFRIGFNFERTLLVDLPSGRSLLAAVLLPLLFMMAAAAALIAIVNRSSLTQPDTLRDVLLIGTAGGITSLASVRLLTGDKTESRLEEFVKLEQIGGTILLVLIAAYFRPQGTVVAWQLPPLGWLFVTVGLGAIMGVLGFGLFRAAPAGPPFIVLLLGLIAMTAGMASYLRLAVIPVCAVAGALLVVLPGEWKDQVRAVLVHMERPVFFILLIVAGALWSPFEWQGWALMALLVGSRLAGKRVAAWIIRRGEPHVLGPDEGRVLALAPIGALAISIVITARDLYPSARVPWMLTASIGAAIAGEIVLQVARRALPEAK